jgi:hypothetical protein
MSSAILERAPIGATGFGTSGLGASAPSSPGTGNWCVVPRCTIKVEKCQGGLKLKCHCDDEVSAATLQNLCKMLGDGLCSCCCTLNGISICQCNLACGICTCEVTKDGVCITCKSGDKACCEIIQACCDCLSGCLDAGCCCYVSFHNTPVCCGSC